MRVKTGLTQAKFAELLGIPRRSIENWKAVLANALTIR